MASRRKSSDRLSESRGSSSWNVRRSQDRTQTSAGDASGNTQERTPSGNERVKEGTLKYGTTPQETPSFRMRSHTSRRISRVFSKFRRTARTTPYRTPRLGTLPRQSAPDIRTANKDNAKLWKEQLRALQNKNLKVCYLSSTSNFKYRNKQLKSKYEKKLKYKIMEVYPSPLVTVSLTTTSCLSLRQSEVDAVSLEVTSMVPGATPDQDTMMVVYMAWIFRTHRVQSSKLEVVEWLPIMLYTGRELIHHVVVDWLQGSFECYVARYGMIQSDLLWLAGAWSGRQCLNLSHCHEDCRIHLTYMIIPPVGMSSFSLPSSRVKPRVVVKVKLQDLHYVWNRLVDSRKNEMSLEEMKKFLSCLDAMAMEITGLPASLLRLHHIQTPCISLSADGKVRLMCQRSVACLIQSLMEMYINAANCFTLEDQLLEPDGDISPDLREESF